MPTFLYLTAHSNAKRVRLFRSFYIAYQNSLGLYRDCEQDLNLRLWLLVPQSNSITIKPRSPTDFQTIFALSIGCLISVIGSYSFTKKHLTRLYVPVFQIIFVYNKLYLKKLSRNFLNFTGLKNPSIFLYSLTLIVNIRKQDLWSDVEWSAISRVQTTLRVPRRFIIYKSGNKS